MDRYAFGGAGLRAAVKAEGAELCALTTGDGLELLWPAAPAWPRHAPVLFPIVGRLAGDRLLHAGHAYTLAQHGFARDLRFDWAETGEDFCRLMLTDRPETLARFPFPFRLELEYRIVGATLGVTYRIGNPGGTVLPVSFGAHPAFRWPLEPGREKAEYVLTFDQPEPAPLRRVVGGLLSQADRKTPVEGRRLALTEALFAEDALIWEAPASRSVRYAAAAGPTLEIAWEGFPQLGVWSRAGGDFVCIEPWRGMASPAGFDGAFLEKPWISRIAPGAALEARWMVTLHMPK